MRYPRPMQLALLIPALAAAALSEPVAAQSATGYQPTTRRTRTTP